MRPIERPIPYEANSSGEKARPIAKVNPKFVMETMIWSPIVAILSAAARDRRGRSGAPTAVFAAEALVAIARIFEELGARMVKIGDRSPAEEYLLASRQAMPGHIGLHSSELVDREARRGQTLAGIAPKES